MSENAVAMRNSLDLGREVAKGQFVKEMMQEKEKSKDEFIDVAMAKFQVVFMKSGFIKTASKLQQLLADVEAQNKREEKESEKKCKGKKSQTIHEVEMGKTNIQDLFSKASNSELMVY